MQCHGRLNDMQNMEIIVFYFERKAQSNCPYIHVFQLLKALVNKTIILFFFTDSHSLFVKRIIVPHAVEFVK